MKSHNNNKFDLFRKTSYSAIDHMLFKLKKVTSLVSSFISLKFVGTQKSVLFKDQIKKDIFLYIFENKSVWAKS